MPPALRLLRPKQWIKGFLVFAAPLFTRQLTNGESMARCALAFIAIALASSVAYILNDLKDVERDRRHPIKNKRPLASGAVGKNLAIGLGLVCAAAAIALSAYLGKGPLLIVGTYLLIQVLYNFGLKHIAVADVFTLSSGYVLRAALGAAAIHVAISGWLLVCTGALAFLVGFGKRRSEFTTQLETGVKTREALDGYSLQGLDLMLGISAAFAGMSYTLYTLQSTTARKYPGILLTAIWVVYAIFRYVFLVVVKGEGGEPETLLLRDPHILFSVALFVLFAVLALGGLRLPILENE